MNRQKINWNKEITVDWSPKGNAPRVAWDFDHKISIWPHPGKPPHFAFSKKQQQGAQLIFPRGSCLVLANFSPVAQWIPSRVCTDDRVHGTNFDECLNFGLHYCDISFGMHRSVFACYSFRSSSFLPVSTSPVVLWRDSSGLAQKVWHDFQLRALGDRFL